MAWVSILSAVFKILNMVLTHVQNAEQRGIGRDIALKEGLEAAKKGIEDAQSARSAVRSSIRNRPSGLRDDDGFRRPTKR